VREPSAGTTPVPENTRTRLGIEISSSAALVAFVSPGQLGRTAANTYDFASVPPVAGDDPVNDSDPTGLYDCSGKSAGYIVNRYSRGSARYTLVCGTSQYGIRHIQDRGHFGGNVSSVVRNELIPATIARGRVENVRGQQESFTKNFLAIGEGLPPENNVFAIIVAVNNQYGRVVTAYSPDPDVDSNPLDHCNWAGISVCAGGGGLGFGGPIALASYGTYSSSSSTADTPCQNSTGIVYEEQ